MLYGKILNRLSIFPHQVEEVVLKMFYRYIFSVLQKRMTNNPRHMQVLIGPRQTGESTLARQFRDSLQLPTHMASADAVGTAHSSWIQQNCETTGPFTKGHTTVIQPQKTRPQKVTE